MLVIKVELWPFGVQDAAVEISRTLVYNKGGNYDDGFDYGVELEAKGVPHLGIAPVEAKFDIKGHDRLTPLPGLLGRVFERFIPREPQEN